MRNNNNMILRRTVLVILAMTALMSMVSSTVVPIGHRVIRTMRMSSNQTVVPTTFYNIGSSGKRQSVLYMCDRHSAPHELAFFYDIQKQLGGSSSAQRTVGFNFIYLNVSCAECIPIINYPIIVEIPSIPNTTTISIPSTQKNVSQLDTQVLVSFFTPEEYAFNVTLTFPCKHPDMVYQFDITIIWDDGAQAWVVALLTLSCFIVVGIAIGIGVILYLRSRSQPQTVDYAYHTIQDPHD